MTNPKHPITHYSLLITHYSLPITHYPLLITHYSLLITHYSLPITHSPLPIPHSPIRRLIKRLQISTILRILNYGCTEGNVKLLAISTREFNLA